MFELIKAKGVATDNSYSDGIVYSVIGTSIIGTGIIEFKDAAYSPME